LIHLQLVAIKIRKNLTQRRKDVRAQEFLGEIGLDKDKVE
jgi:hypothetical protein